MEHKQVLAGFGIVVLDRVCETCGTTFTPSSRSNAGKFCSPTCYHAAGHQKRSVRDRFWAKVDKAGSVPVHVSELGNCWLWMGYRTPRGYGKIGKPGIHATALAHRVAYELQIGPIPAGLHVLHRCDNPPCVRGSHLFTGTDADNMADMVAKGRGNAPRGEAQHRAKLTEQDVRIIRERYAAGGIRQSDLAAEYGIPQTAISAIVLQKTWKNVES